MALTFATICWAFDVEADPSFPVDPLAFSPTFVSHALPFRCRITPRSPSRAALVRAEGREALAQLE